jgi:hypothetical protein
LAHEYVTKLREDQISAEAEHAILSSLKFPAESRQLHVQDGVIIANPARVLPAPTPAPTAAKAAAAANERHNEQEDDRADRCVDDRRHNPDAEVNAELGQEPVANKSSDDSDYQIADDPKPGASHDLARQPSGNDADQHYHKETLTRHVHLTHLQFRSWLGDPAPAHPKWKSG